MSEGVQTGLPGHRPSSRRRWLWILGVLIAAALAGFGYWAHDKGRLPEWRPVTYATGSDATSLMGFMPDGKTIVWGASDGIIGLLDVATGGSQKFSVPKHGDMWTLAISPDGKTVAIGCDDGAIIIWDVGSHKVKATWRGLIAHMRNAGFTLDGKSLIAIGIREANKAKPEEGPMVGVIERWDVASGKPQVVVDGLAGTLPCAISFDGKMVAVCNGDFELWDVAAKKKKAAFPDSEPDSEHLEFTRDGKRLLSAEMGGVTIWDLASGKAQACLKSEGVRLQPYSFAVSPDGKLAATGGYSGGLRIWDIEAERDRMTLPTEADGIVRVLAFSPDGKWLACGDNHGIVRVWDMALLPPSAAAFSGPPQPAFHGSGDALQQTIIVPTLDTPIVQGKSAVWCSSFQLGWNEFKKLAHEPIEVLDAEAITDRLNRAPQSTADLLPGSFVTIAGFLKDGVFERIQDERAKHFPDAAPLRRPHRPTRPWRTHF